jgi:hypothetical protein
MENTYFCPKAKSYGFALIFGLAIYIALASITFIFKPQMSDICPVEPPLNGLLVVFGGGLGSSGSVSIGGKGINLSTDLFGSDGGAAAVRGVGQNLFVYAERVSVPTLFGSKPVVVLIRSASGEVIYQRSAARVIDGWLSSSLGLGALVSFLIAGASYFFIAQKLQRIRLKRESRPVP